MTTQDIRFRLGVDGAQQAAASANAVAQSLDKISASAAKVSGGGPGIAQLSAQIQDFVVQVQAGQSPLTALLQQGSQLSSMQGGLAGSFRTLTSAVSPAMAALGTAAAAVGALALAYSQGSREDDEFIRGIVLSGNAAGVTSGQLREMARAQDEVVGTQAKAAEVVARLAATGTISAASISKVGEAITRMEREGVAGVEELVKRFDGLGRTPLQTLLRLNEAENFLTKSVYDQVRALEQRGQVAEAARVAQEAYANSGITRAKELEGQLGAIERGWRSIKSVASEAWDAMLGIGRKLTLEDQLKQAEAQLAAIGDPRRGGNNLQAEERRAAVRSRVEELRQQIYAEREAAAVQQASAQGVKAHAAAQDELERARKTAADAAKRQIEAGKELVQQMALEAAGFSGNFIDNWRKLDAAYRAGAISASEYAQAHQRLIEQQPALQNAARATLEIARAVQAARNAENAGIEAYERAQVQAAERVLKSLDDRVTGLRAEAEASIVSQRENVSLAQAIEMVAIARLEEKLAGLNEGGTRTEEVRKEIAARRELLNLIASKEVREANAESAKLATQQWERAADTIAGLLTNAIRMGGEAGWDYIEDYIKANAINAVVRMGVDWAGGALGLASAAGGGGAQGGGMNWLSALSGARSAYSTAAGWFGGGSAAAGGSLGAVTGPQVYASMAAAEGITVDAGAAAATAGGSSAAASAIPIIGWIIAGIMASKAAYAGGNNLSMLSDAKDYGIGLWEEKNYKVLESLGFSEKWAQILSGAPLTARLFGHKASVSGFGFGTVSGGDFIQSGSSPLSFGANVLGGGAQEGLQGLASDIAAAVGLAAGTFGGKLTEGLRVGAFTDRDRDNEVAALLGFFGADNKLIAGTQTGTGAFSGTPGNAGKINADELQKWINEQMPVLIVQGLQQSSLDKRFEDYFDALGDASKLTPEKANEVLQVAGAVQQLTEAFGPLGGVFTQFGTISVDTFEKLAKGAGGFEALGSSLGSFYQEFYTGAQQTELASKSVRNALAGVGLVMPDLSQSAEAAHAQYVALLNAQDLNTEAGRKAFNVLIANAGAFDQLSDSADAAAQRLQGAIARAAPKFLAPAELQQFQATGIAANLKKAGVDVSVEQLLSATKQQIRTFAESFLALGDASIDAKIAVIEAAEALLELKGNADEAAPQMRVLSQAQADAGREALKQWRGFQANAQLFTQQLASGNLSGGLQGYVDNWWGGASNIPGPTLNGLFNEWMMRTDLGALVNANGVARNMGQEGGINPSQDALTQATQEQERATQELIRSLQQVDQSLEQFLDNMLTGSLSALSPEDQLKTAREQFEAFVGQGIAGDNEAARRAQDAATVLLSLQKDFSGAPAYAPVFDMVAQRLDELHTAVEKRLGDLEKAVNRGTETAAAGLMETSGAVREGNTLAERSLTGAVLQGARNALA